MTVPDRKICAALALVPDWNPDEVTVDRNLGGGPATDTWLISNRGERFVLRLDKPLVKILGLDRYAEAAMHAQAANAGIAPPLVCARPEHGLLLSRYVDGRTWTTADLQNPAQLRRLAMLLHDLHVLHADGAAFDLRRAVRRYAEALATTAAAEWAERARLILDTLPVSAPVLCHNDPIPDNIIDGQRLWLIDWEYAAPGDPFFDLAVVVRHHELPEDRAITLLNTWAKETEPEDLIRLKNWCAFYDLLLALWLSVVALESHLTPEQQTQLQSATARIENNDQHTA